MRSSWFAPPHRHTPLEPAKTQALPDDSVALEESPELLRLLEEARIADAAVVAGTEGQHRDAYDAPDGEEESDNEDG